MVVEFFCVVAIILKRHPELRLNKILDAQKLIADAVGLYGTNTVSASPNADAAGTKDPSTEEFQARILHENFKRESVSITSMFFAKATVQFVMYDCDIIAHVENAAASVYECPIQ